MNQATDVITFGGTAQPAEEAARAAIIPVPLETTVSYGRGTSLGPAAVMIASRYMELYDEFLEMEPASLGVLTRARVDVSGSIQECLDRVEAAVTAELEAGRLPAVLGGEHTAALGALRALVKQRGPDFTVVTLDAHLDLRDVYQGRKISHACVMRRALDLGLPVRHVGVRSCSAREARFIRERGLAPVWARQAAQDPDWLDRALDGLEGPVYISLDVDGLDPACMPATGAPEPGGLSWEQVTDWLDALCRGRRVLGLDLVELAPIAGQQAWDFTAARLLNRALGLALRSRGCFDDEV